MWGQESLGLGKEVLQPMDPWVREKETEDKLRVTETLPFRKSYQPSQALQMPVTLSHLPPGSPRS